MQPVVLRVTVLGPWNCPGYGCAFAGSIRTAFAPTKSVKLMAPDQIQLPPRRRGQRIVIGPFSACCFASRFGRNPLRKFLGFNSLRLHTDKDENRNMGPKQERNDRCIGEHEVSAMTDLLGPLRSESGGRRAKGRDS